LCPFTCDDHRCARERDRHARREPHARGVLGGDQQREERVVPRGLRRQDPVEAEFLDAARPRGEAADPEFLRVARKAVALDERNSDTHRLA
jgi:hypothetical protein